MEKWKTEPPELFHADFWKRFYWHLPKEIARSVNTQEQESEQSEVSSQGITIRSKVHFWIQGEYLLITQSSSLPLEAGND